MIAQTPALRRRRLEQRDGWRAAGVCTSAPGARAGRLERARPRRSHLWQAGAARCHVRGARRSSEPTNCERSDGQRLAAVFSERGSQRRAAVRAPLCDGNGHVRRVGVAVIRSRLASARCPRAERLDHFAPPIPSRPEGEPAGRRWVDRAVCRPGATVRAALADRALGAADRRRAAAVKSALASANRVGIAGAGVLRSTADASRSPRPDLGCRALGRSQTTPPSPPNRATSPGSPPGS